jgi:hypothetical protein
MGLVGIAEKAPLPSTTLTTLCCSFAPPRASRGCILYNFDEPGIWKRITFHSDFYGEREGRGYMSVECIRPTEDISDEALFVDFKSHVISRGVFGDDIRLEHVMTLTSAYPVLNFTAEEARDHAIRSLAEFGIGTAGRHGTFDYIPHSTVAVDKALAWIEGEGTRILGPGGTRSQQNRDPVAQSPGGPET